jgi:hypothetical protein
MKKKSLATILIFLVTFFVAGVLKTKAGVGDNTTGWLWGGSDDGNATGQGVISTGPGWVSMNSTNTGAAVSYGVTIPPSTCTGTACDLSGYAWSENIGWISFNAADVSGCPTPDSTYGCAAFRPAGTNNIQGWARIMSIVQAGANSGGWQGWIHLNGSGYGIVLNTDGSMTSTSYGWSNELGWINFGRAKTVSSVVNGSCGSASTGQSCLSSAPSTNLCLTGTPSAVSGTGVPTWSWTCAGAGGGSTASCSIAGPSSGSCGSSNGGTFSSTPTANLCLDGTTPTVSGSGPWTWVCAGYCGGSSSPTCSASVSGAGGGNLNIKSWKEVAP